MPSPLSPEAVAHRHDRRRRIRESGANRRRWAPALVTIGGVACLWLPWWRLNAQTMVVEYWSSRPTSFTRTPETWRGVEMVGTASAALLALLALATLALALAAAWRESAHRWPRRTFAAEARSAAIITGAGLVALAAATMFTWHATPAFGALMTGGLGLIASASAVLTDDKPLRWRRPAAGALTLTLALFGMQWATAHGLEGPSTERAATFRVAARLGHPHAARTGQTGPIAGDPRTLTTFDGAWAVVADESTLLTVDDHGRVVVLVDGSGGEVLAADGDHVLVRSPGAVTLVREDSAIGLVSLGYAGDELGRVGPDGSLLVFPARGEGARLLDPHDQPDEPGVRRPRDLPDVGLDWPEIDPWTIPVDGAFVRLDGGDGGAQLVRVEGTGEEIVLAGSDDLSCGFTSVATRSWFEASWDGPIESDGDGGWWLAVSPRPDADPRTLVHVDRAGTMRYVPDRAPAPIVGLALEADGDLAIATGPPSGPSEVLVLDDALERREALPAPAEDCGSDAR
ncbi:MAG: hypothetical protein S0880_27700 [Actinomycetota bacterium]|nr:hypothetical protein [Actinomycetota bacterium]